LLVNASSPKEAAKLALTQWTEGGFAFGKILMVSETGFDSDNEEDLFFLTEALLEELGIEYRDFGRSMTLNSIAKEWRGYASMVFDGKQPSPVQIEEMKKAFFAGFWSLFAALEQIGEPEISEKEGEAYLEARRAECVTFKDQLLANHESPLAAKQLRYMTEPELNAHITRQIEFLKMNQTPDTIGSMLVIFQDDGITQYGATVAPDTAPAALRELADRLERRDTVTR